MNKNEKAFIGHRQAQGDNKQSDYRTLFWIEALAWVVLITLIIW